jgi:hypothetical protein
LPDIGTNSQGSKFQAGTNYLGNFGRPEHLVAGPSSLIHLVGMVLDSRTVNILFLRF